MSAPVTGPPSSQPRPTDEELERLSHRLTLGRLAPGVIHEINNPLFAVLGLVEQAREDAEAGSRLERRLGLVERSALEIRDIVRVLTGFAREPAEPRPLELDAVARETLALFERTSTARDVTTALESGPGPLTVVVAAKAVKIVLLELMANAESAMSAGGSLTVTVAREGDAVVARVADTGPGVPEELQERVFEPFVTSRPGAPGVGLAVARAAARGQGGELALERARPSATFALRLPAAS